MKWSTLGTDGIWGVMSGCRSSAFLACVLACAPIFASAQRRPLTVEPTTVIEHEPTAPRYRADSSGRVVSYDVEGRISYVASLRSFVISWNGADGIRREIEWRPGNGARAVVQAEVSYDSSSKLYSYEYTFENLAGAEQGLESVYLEADALREVIIPSTAWHSRALSSTARSAFSLAEGWAFSEVRSGLGILPDQSVSGFVLRSESPPGIVGCIAAGSVPQIRSDEVLPQELSDAISDAAFNLPRGVTVGPVAADTAGSVVEQLDRVAAHVAVSRAHGWITSDSVAASTDGQLARIRAAVFAGDRARATVLVDELQSRVQMETAILSEAQSLLNFGLAVLRRKLSASGL